MQSLDGGPSKVVVSCKASIFLHLSGIRGLAHRYGSITDINLLEDVKSMDTWVLQRAKTAEFNEQRIWEIAGEGDYFIWNHKEVAIYYRGLP